MALSILRTVLQRHIREEGRQMILLSGTVFTPFQATLDGEMKRLQSLGIGTHRRQVEVITVEEEDLLWEKGQLDTMVFYCGLYFLLGSGKEHRQLCRFPCQIQLVETPNSSHVIYRKNSTPAGWRDETSRQSRLPPRKHAEHSTLLYKALQQVPEFVSVRCSSRPFLSSTFQFSIWNMLVFTAFTGLPSPVNHGFPDLQVRRNDWLQNEPFIEGHVDQLTIPVRCRRAACHGAIETPQHGRVRSYKRLLTNRSVLSLTSLTAYGRQLEPR